jgi:hypothetical protein
MMELDPNYKVPAGFRPVLNYCPPYETTGCPVVGEVLLVVDENTSSPKELKFYIDDAVPTLPLRAHGQIYHNGWDIPTRWAIDASGKCWKDNAHGHGLEPTLGRHLLGETSDSPHSRQEIVRHIAPPVEEWCEVTKYQAVSGDRRHILIVGQESKERADRGHYPLWYGSSEDKVVTASYSRDDVVRTLRSLVPHDEWLLAGQPTRAELLARIAELEAPRTA